MVQAYSQLVPFDRNGKDDDEVFRELLLARAKSRLAQLREKLLERERLDDEIESLRRYLDDLNPVLRDEGLDPVIAPDVGPAKQPIGTPGNRSSNLPPRRDRFATMTLADAVGLLLADGEEWHADDLVKAIFEIQDHRQLRPTKATLASALRSGTVKGRWDRVAGKGNTFRRKEEAMEANT